MNEVRLCEHCGHSNDIAFLECEECGSDLSMVIPAEPLHPSGGQWFLTALTGEKIKIDAGTILGRLDSPCAALLNVSDFVSRHHARFTLERESLMIEDTSTNGTQVNGKRLEKNVPCPLKDGDTLSVGEISFEVHHAD